MTSDRILTINDPGRWDQWQEDGLPSGLASRLTHLGCFDPAAIADVVDLAAELEAQLGATTAVEAVQTFLAAGDDYRAACDRRAALRVLEKVGRLGGASQRALKPIGGVFPVHPDPVARRRPLTPIERGLVRQCAKQRRIWAGSVGLLDSGATSGELGRIGADAFSMDDGSRVNRVHLPGTQRQSGCGYTEACPRTVEIASWARDALTSVASASPTGSPILYQGRSSDPGKVQSSVLMNVGAVLTDAGLRSDPTVKPSSIRNTAGRAVADADGIEAAAEMLGHDDLMAVAREIGLRPHRPRRL